MVFGNTTRFDCETTSFLIDMKYSYKIMFENYLINLFL